MYKQWVPLFLSYLSDLYLSREEPLCLLWPSPKYTSMTGGLQWKNTRKSAAPGTLSRDAEVSEVSN